MINFYKQINFIDLMYMRKRYGSVCNAKTIATLSAFKLKQLFASEDKSLVLGYKIDTINKFIRLNYEHTVKFLNTLKRIIRRNRIKLNDLNEQELLLLEERVFSTNRNIKVLATNFPTSKNERIGIKFIKATLFKNINDRFILLALGELLISNKRIIFIDDKQPFIFDWAKIKNHKYQSSGFTFMYQHNIFTLNIHDNETLNSTISNYLSRINLRFKS